jgi:hypothetical protein
VGTASRGSQHATARAVNAASSTGSSSGHRAKRWGQRGWNRQPVGGRAGSGTSPGSASGIVPAPSERGTAAISASV